MSKLKVSSLFKVINKDIRMTAMANLLTSEKLH